MGTHHANSVRYTGALSGECLVGVRPLNLELIVRISENQPSNLEGGGPIVGEFDLLHAGSGDYHVQLASLVGRRFESAQALLDELRLLPGASKASHILNRGELASLRRLLEALPEH
jgi:hypothetical protein